MGTTYHYANFSKREWFSTDSLGGSAKLAGLGLNLAARAFDLLLVTGPAPSESGPIRAGRWAGDAIAIVGDSDENWARYLGEFADLEADVIVLVYDYDGFEPIGAAAEKDRGLFMQLCHLVATRQALQFEAELKQQFGPNFWQRYKDLCRENPYFKPKDMRPSAGR